MLIVAQAERLSTTPRTATANSKGQGGRLTGFEGSPTGHRRIRLVIIGGVSDTPRVPTFSARRLVAVLLKSEKPEPLRIQFAPTWLEEWDDHDRDRTRDDLVSVPAPEIAPQATRTCRCHRCGGDLIRSHVRRYERPLTFFGIKPYRCTDCKTRRWR